MDFLISIALSFGALYFGSRIISAKMPLYKLLIISTAAHIFETYLLDYVMKIGNMFPIPHIRLIIRAIIWVGLVNFVVPKTTPKQYLIVGSAAFLFNYFLEYFGLVSLI